MPENLTPNLEALNSKLGLKIVDAPTNAANEEKIKNLQGLKTSISKLQQEMLAFRNSCKDQLKNPNQYLQSFDAELGRMFQSREKLPNLQNFIDGAASALELTIVQCQAKGMLPNFNIQGALFARYFKEKPLWTDLSWRNALPSEGAVQHKQVPASTQANGRTPAQMIRDQNTQFDVNPEFYGRQH